MRTFTCGRRKKDSHQEGEGSGNVSRHIEAKGLHGAMDINRGQACLFENLPFFHVIPPHVFCTYMHKNEKMKNEKEINTYIKSHIIHIKGQMPRKGEPFFHHVKIYDIIF